MTKVIEQPFTALHPLTALLLRLQETVLGPAAGPASTVVPPELRCAGCKSAHTRMKSPVFHPTGLDPIQGFRLRCRLCGATNQISTTDGAAMILIAPSQGGRRHAR